MGGFFNSRASYSLSKAIFINMNNNDFEKMLLETCGCGEGDGIEVFMQNLAKIHEFSGAVMSMVQNHEELEDWIEDKVSKAAQSMNDVKQYLEYRSTAFAVQQHGATPMPDSGERMPVMTQKPQMTNPSSMSLQQALGAEEDMGYGEYDDYGGGDVEAEVVLGGEIDAPEEEDPMLGIPSSDDEDEEEMLSLNAG